MMMNMAMMMMNMTMTVMMVMMKLNKSLTWGNTKIAAMAITAMVAMEPISEMTMTITLAMAMVITMAMVFSMGTTTMAVMVAMEPMSENHSKFNPWHMSSDNVTYILLTQYYNK